MNLKELLPALLFALLTTIGLQYFFGLRKSAIDSTSQPQSGQRFTVPRLGDLAMLKPLNTEVDFYDKKITKKPVITSLTTEHARYEFSTEGASLERVEFKRNWGGKTGYLSTIFPPDFQHREERALLVGLNEQTPFYFDLIDKVEEQDRFILDYKAEVDKAFVHKQFCVYKNEFRIDLTLTVAPKEGAGPVQARIFFPSPLVPELGDKDTITAIVNNEKNKVQILAKDEQLLTEYWSKPSLFGAQDRYFVHSMVADKNDFVQRGYFAVKDLVSLHAILEGPEITEKTTWQVSFYFGPKEDHALVQVDPRLQQTLNYGWLAFISRPVSKIMLEILNFFYTFTRNYGLAIILLTLLMRLLLIPFTLKSEKARDKQLEFQKKLKHVEMKYKDDKQALALARAELIKKHGMPGLGGCLPLLGQIPLFIALAWVLSNSIELYMAPFLWISDLSSPDPLYILPVLIALIMIFYTPGPQTSDPKQRMLSSFFMALIVGAFAINLSAGLSLYIFTSTALMVIQTYVLKRFA